MLEDNPAIWNSIAETAKRIFPPHQTIFVTLPFSVLTYGEIIETQPSAALTTFKVKNDVYCSMDQREFVAYYWTLNGTRVQHIDMYEEYDKTNEHIQFNTSHLEDLIIKNIHDVCMRPVLVSPLVYPYIPGLLDKKSFIVLLKLDVNNDVNYESEYDTGKNWREVILILRYSTYAFDSGARFLVAIIDLPCSKEKVLKMFRVMNFDFNLNDVYILTQGSNPGTMELFTWYPYELPSGECGKPRDAVLLDTWVDTEDGGHFVKNLDFSLNKNPTDIVNCCLEIPHAQDGIRSKIVSLVSRKMNRNSETCTEVINVIPRQNSFDYPQFRARFFTFDFRFFVPVAESYFSWSSITDVFHVSAWMFVIFSFLTAAFFVKWLAGSSYCVENPGYNEIVRCLMSSWSMLLGIGDSILPINAPMRIFLFSWILYSMCIGTVFQAFFNSYFVVPGRLHQIDSVQELAENNATLLFVSYDTFMRFSIAYNLAHYSYFVYQANAYKYMINTPNTALFSNTLEFSYYMTQYCGKQTSRTFHRFSGNEMQVDDFLIVSDALIQPLLKRIVTQLVEGGIPEKIIREKLNPSGDYANMFELEKVTDNFFALSFLHLWSVFGLILALHVLSLFIFISELLWHEIKNYRISRRIRRTFLS
ncbi:Ionotropic receptor 790 [Blattella germanica]|nr:Ionotropic receptor 790 [Blattella germanica]